MNDYLYPLMGKEQQAAHDCLIDLLSLFEQRAPHLHSHFLDLSGISLPHSTVFFQNTFFQVNFRGADFSFVRFPGCTFRECDLDKADMDEADLRHTFFWRCSLVEVQDTTANTSESTVVECQYHVPIYREKPLVRPQTLMGAHELLPLFPRAR